MLLYQELKGNYFLGSLEKDFFPINKILAFQYANYFFFAGSRWACPLISLFFFL